MDRRPQQEIGEICGLAEGGRKIPAGEKPLPPPEAAAPGGRAGIVFGQAGESGSPIAFARATTG